MMPTSPSTGLWNRSRNRTQNRGTDTDGTRLSFFGDFRCVMPRVSVRQRLTAAQDAARDPAESRLEIPESRLVRGRDTGLASDESRFPNLESQSLSADARTA